MTVANVGGEPIDGTATLTLTHQDSSADQSRGVVIDADGLEPGESLTQSASIDPLNAGTWQFEPGADSFYDVADSIDDTLTVQSQQFTLGERIRTGTGLRSTLDDRVLMVVELTAEFAKSTSLFTNDSFLQLPTGTHITETIRESDYPTTRLANLENQAGSTDTATIVAAVDKDDVRNGDVQIGINVNQFESPADFVLDVPAHDAFPQFLFETANVPQTIPDGERFTVGLDVKNMGDQEGTFRAVMEFNLNDDQGLFSSYESREWYLTTSGRFEATIPARESKTVTSEFTFTDFEGSVDYRIKPIDYNWTATFE